MVWALGLFSLYTPYLRVQNYFDKMQLDVGKEPYLSQQ